MRKITNYIDENILKQYYVTKTGNIYSKQYDADELILMISMRKEGTSYEKISKKVSYCPASVYNKLNNPIKPLYKKLKGKKDRDGYIEYSLYKEDGTPKYFRGHRIVGYCYLDLTDEMYINHKNGVKNDNRVSNLEVVTDSQNKQHAVNMLGVDYTKNVKSEWIKVEISNTQFKKEYESVKELCRDYPDFSYVYLLKKLKDNNGKCQYKGYKIQRVDN